MSVTTNPFGTHEYDGTYLDDEHGHPYKPGDPKETFLAGESYLIHKAGGHHGGDGAHGDDDHSSAAGHGDDHSASGSHAEEGHDDGWIKRRFEYKDEYGKTVESVQQFGPPAFGALFFFITGFHGFHVFSGVLFLTIIMINAASGVYVARKNGYEMVEKIGLYWHFVDLVWVFVFLVFYLL